MNRVKNAVAAVVVTGALVMGAGMLATAAADTPGVKVGICHRTASDTNPYVYIEVADEAAAQAHIGNTEKGHFPKKWKSDGTWRGVEHVKGDAKDDYLASSDADCSDIVVTTPTETTEPTTQTTDTTETTDTTDTTETTTVTTGTTSTETVTSPTTSIIPPSTATVTDEVTLDFHGDTVQPHRHAHRHAPAGIPTAVSAGQ